MTTTVPNKTPKKEYKVEKPFINSLQEFLRWETNNGWVLHTCHIEGNTATVVLERDLVIEKAETPQPNSERLAEQCLRLGATPAEVGAWSDEKRQEYITEKTR